MSAPQTITRIVAAIVANIGVRPGDTRACKHPLTSDGNFDRAAWRCFQNLRITRKATE